MDPLDLITDPTLHSYALAALTIASLSMPLLEWIANRTATDLDNRAVALLARVLSFVPRVRLGNTKLSAATVARTSMKPPSGSTLTALLALAIPASMTIGFVAIPAGCAGTPTPREALEGAKRAQQSMERMCEELERTRAVREGVTDVLDQAANGTPVEPVLEQPAAPSPEGPAPADAPQ